MNDTSICKACFGKVCYYFSPQDFIDSGVTLAMVTKISKDWHFFIWEVGNHLIHQCAKNSPMGTYSAYMYQICYMKRAFFSIKQIYLKSGHVKHKKK